MMQGIGFMSTPNLAGGSAPAHMLPSTPGVPSNLGTATPGNQQQMATDMAQNPFASMVADSSVHLPIRRASSSGTVLSDAVKTMQLQRRAVAASLQQYTGSTPSVTLSAESDTTLSHSSGPGLATGGVPTGDGGITPSLAVAQQAAALHQALGSLSSLTAAGIPAPDTSRSNATDASSTAGQATKYMKMMSGERSSKDSHSQLRHPASHQQQHASTPQPAQAMLELPCANNPPVPLADSHARPPPLDLQLIRESQKETRSVDMRPAPSQEESEQVYCVLQSGSSHFMHSAFLCIDLSEVLHCPMPKPVIH